MLTDTILVSNLASGNKGVDLFSSIGDNIFVNIDKGYNMKLAAGKYVIADPCYVLEDADYSRLLKDTDYFMMNSVDRGGVMVDKASGKYFAVFSTKYGDGLYRDNKGFGYGVDAGCIACIPVEMCNKDEDNDYINEVTFERNFEVYYEDGLIVFGDVIINTDPDDFYDEEEESYEDVA